MSTISEQGSVGIVAAATYIPATAMTYRKATLPVPNGDEDVITMAIEAGLACLGRWNENPESAGVDEVWLVAGSGALTATHSEVVREGLGLAADLHISLSTGDGLGVVAALTHAADAVTAGRVVACLVIACEVGDGRHTGAGAVGVVVARAAEPEVTVTDVRSEGAVVFDSWPRAGGGPPFANEPRYVQRSVERGLASVLADGQRTELPLYVTGTQAKPASVTLNSGQPLPDFGTAGVLIALITGARASNGPFRVAALTGTRTVLLTCNAGRHAAERLAEPDFATASMALLEPKVSPMLSLPGSSPFFERSSRELLRLEGAACTNCTQTVFPPSQRPVCSHCHGTAFTPKALSRRGTVHTYTVNNFLPVGFSRQMVLVLADLDDGHRYWAPATGVAPDDVAIGTPVRLTIRRFTDHGDAPVYAMKFILDEQSARPSTVAAGVS